MGVGILQGDYRTTMSFKFTVFKHVSYSNFSQQLSQKARILFTSGKRECIKLLCCISHSSACKKEFGIQGLWNVAVIATF